MDFSKSQEEISKVLKEVNEKKVTVLSNKLMKKIDEELDKQVIAVEKKRRK